MAKGGAKGGAKYWKSRFHLVLMIDAVFLFVFSWLRLIGFAPNIVWIDWVVSIVSCITGVIAFWGAFKDDEKILFFTFIAAGIDGLLNIVCIILWAVGTYYFNNIWIIVAFIIHVLLDAAVIFLAYVCRGRTFEWYYDPNK